MYYNWMSWYEFDEERDLNPYFKCWILFGTFCIPALKPMPLWLGQVACCHQRMHREAEKMSCPTHMVWDSRTKDGYFYFAMIEIPEDE